MKLSFVGALFLLGLIAGAQAFTIFTDRAALEALSGPLAQGFFELLGTGSAGSYYDFPSNNFVDNSYPAEVVTTPWQAGGLLSAEYGLYSTDVLLGAPNGRGFPNYLRFDAFLDPTTSGVALGVYNGIGPLDTPVVGESARGAVEEADILSIWNLASVSTGDFIGFYGDRIERFSTSWNGPVGRDNYNSLLSVVGEPSYIIAGGDPHIRSFGEHSEMAVAKAEDVFILVDHPDIVVTAMTREFDFLPSSMEAVYFGTVGIELLNGDRVVVEAFEEDGEARHQVTVNGVVIEPGFSSSTYGYDLVFDEHKNLPYSGPYKESAFKREFPYQNHHAILRLYLHRRIIVDVSLTSNDVFVDWRHAQPIVYEQKGAFLNVNMRDLVLPSRTGGVLSRSHDEHVHLASLRRDIKEIEERIAGTFTEKETVVDRPLNIERPSMHQLEERLTHLARELRNFNLQERIDEIVTSHKIDSLFGF